MLTSYVSITVPLSLGDFRDFHSNSTVSRSLERHSAINPGSSLNESLHSNLSTFSIPHVNNFFQITISKFSIDSMTIFIKLDRLSSVMRLQR